MKIVAGLALYIGSLSQGGQRRCSWKALASQVDMVNVDKVVLVTIG